MNRTVYSLCLIFIMAFAVPLTAQDVDACLDCHDDSGWTENRDGRVVSMHVDIEKFNNSIHGKEEVTCIDCHADLDGFDLDEDEHPERLEPVDCAECHDDVADIYRSSMHGTEIDNGNPHAPQCWDCHGAHNILPSNNPESKVNKFNIPIMCGSCHKEGAAVARMYDIPQDSILTNYSLSIHGEGLYKRGLTISAVCSDCHTAHSVLPHTNPASSIHRDNVAGTCQQCHGRIEEVHQKIVAGELWETEPDKVPACIECHQPHKVRKVYYEEGVSTKECLDCHGKHDITTTRKGEIVSLYVDAAVRHDSAHRDVACAQCHTGATPSLERSCSTIINKVDCSICHADQVEQHNSSTHGQLLAKGDPDAPDCESCHGTHDIMSNNDIDSPTYVSNISTLCGKCHSSGAIADNRREDGSTSMVENYVASVHGRAMQESGLVVSATCTHCHTAHQVLPQDNLESSIHRANIVDTCSNCHKGIFETFKKSIHFTGEENENDKLPMCDDCHTSHAISRTAGSGFKLEVVESCGHCHEDVMETYFETFHGKVSGLGFDAAAKCQDCHGAHNILPQMNQDSLTSRTNIVATCGQCHEGSHERFAGFMPHATHHDKDKYPGVYWTWFAMTGLLIGTFTFFGIHTLLWLPRSFQAIKHGKYLRKKSEGQQEVKRFSRLHRQLHVLVIISFLSLAVTGMTLKYAYMPWAQNISLFLGGFAVTGFVHRVAAVVTFFYFAAHIMQLVGMWKESKKSIKDYLLGEDSMVPNARDGRELVQTFKWFIGMGERPNYGRWTYWEKFDYFAVFWGVAMIGFTGLTLWFPEFFTRFLPGSFINIATVIHSDEALLATGFIFTIHFFNTHFRPDKFPMDPVIFTGSVPLEEFKEDRPREYQELVESGKLEELLVDPKTVNEIRWRKLFGFTALIIGLSLVVLIIVAQLGGYH